MKVLIIKTSSFGDIIHTLPALTEAASIMPTISFDWVVEEAFIEIPSWHPHVSKVIPIALRRLRKNSPLQFYKTGKEIKKFWENLRTTKYDQIIDAQGLLIKSGLVSLCARGIRNGFDWQSAREPLASLCYQRRFSIAKNQHAITRTRKLFASTFGYAINPNELPPYRIEIETTDQDLTLQSPHTKTSTMPKKEDFSLCGDNKRGYEKNTISTKDRNQNNAKSKRKIIFIHGTSREEKNWSEDSWRNLARLASKENLIVQLPWGNEKEHQRAMRIAKDIPNIEVLDKMNLTALAKTFLNASLVISGDTGPGHLASALNLPTITVYISTDPKFVGSSGRNQINLVLEGKGDNIAIVWQKLQLLLSNI